MKYLVTTLCALFLMASVPVQAAHLEPIVNYENQEIKRFDTRKLSIEEVQMAIRNAAEKNKWRVEPGEAGHIIATLVVRNQHTAVVDIAYTTTSFSITYKSSENLNYSKDNKEAAVNTAGVNTIGYTGIVTSKSGPVIHPSYNKWVQQFKDAIFRELQR